MPVGGGGRHPDPQAGERAGAAAHHDGVEVAHRHPRVGEGGQHVRREPFGVRPGVDGDPLGQHGRVVAPDDPGRHRRGGGVESEDETHASGPLPRSDPHVGAAEAFQTNVEVPLGEAFDEALAPLHDHDRVVEFGVEVQ